VSAAALARRWLRGLALVLGSGLLAGGCLALLVFAVRYAQVKLFYSPIETERDAEKAVYLGGVAPASAEAPNFVVIFFDDLGWGDLSSYGNPLIRTPRIDALAAEGVRMTAFYSASPVCTPSRAALLTGRYPIRSNTHRHVFFSEASPVATLRKMLGWGNELSRDEILLPEVLSAAGYATGMVGKWHLGGIPGHLPNDFGFDSFYGVLWSNDMVPLHRYRDAEIEDRDDWGGVGGLAGFRDADSDTGEALDQRTLTQQYTDEAVAFIEAHRDERFFLYFAHSFPHVPHFTSREHAGKSEGGLYGDVVEDLDRSVGEVLDALARLGLAEDTLVIVTSDNGADYNGSPGFTRGRKGETYEGGMRVPLIARWPAKIPRGVVTDEIAMNIDVFPTLLGLAGVPLPSDRTTDGRDLMPLLRGSSGSPHETLVYMSAGTGSVEAVRDARFKYLAESGDPGRSKPQLWRMDVPGPEAHNLAERFPDDATRLASELERWRADLAENPRGWR
jgi:arylsulfatase A-like enzyme